jgi:serine/threonine-protein kinase HipA
VIRKLEVQLSFAPGQGTVVGTLAHVERRIWFEYDPGFLASGPEISPFKFPKAAGLHENRDRDAGALPGVFEDSIPDGWGLLLMDREFRRRGIDPATVSPLDRLAFVGDRAMGALAYRPAEEVAPDRAPLDLATLAPHVEDVLEGRAVDVLPQLLRAGGSPAGARPKILVGACGDRLISGATDLPPGYDPWMIKLAARSDLPDAGPIEYAYALMAGAAGIAMQEARLIEVDRSRRYFAVRRFDRLAGNARRHLHTFGHLVHANFLIPGNDYRQLLKVTLALTRNHGDLLRAFRQMVFNVACHNRDDHVKNFAFLMGPDGDWTLSPAYDLTHSAGPGGEHTMTVLGEGRSPGPDRCLALALFLPVAVDPEHLRQVGVVLLFCPSHRLLARPRVRRCQDQRQQLGRQPALPVRGPGDRAVLDEVRQDSSGTEPGQELRRAGVSLLGPLLQARDGLLPGGRRRLAGRESQEIEHLRAGRQAAQRERRGILVRGGRHLREGRGTRPASASSAQQLVVGPQTLIRGQRPAVAGQQAGSCVLRRLGDQRIVDATARETEGRDPLDEAEVGTCREHQRSVREPGGQERRYEVGRSPMRRR